MQVMTEHKVVPKLRFKEFKGDWKRSTLRKESKFQNGKGHEQNIDPNGKYVVVNSKFVSTEGRVRKFTNEIICPLAEDSIVMVMSDIPKGKALAKCFYIDKNNLYSLNQRICSLTSEYNFNKFLFYRLNRLRYFLKFDTGYSQTNLRKDEVLNAPINLPTLREQQKIAIFLTAVDKKLQQLTKKKELLEAYKKGVMQKIFSQELRFKDEFGNNYPDWEEKKLGELCEFAKSGGTPKSTNKEYYNGNIPFLSISDMTKQGKYLNYATKSISQEGVSNSSSWIVPINTIIYSMYASVGFVAINKIPIATSQAVINLGLKSNCNTEFIYYNLVEIKNIIHRFIETGTQGNLNAQTVKNLKLELPCLKEQEKIANFLSSIDKKIELVSTQIENTKAFKKGLLQQMFV